MKKLWLPIGEYTKEEIDRALVDTFEVLQVLILGSRLHRHMTTQEEPVGEPDINNWQTCLAGCWAIKTLGSTLHVEGEDVHLYKGREIVRGAIHLSRYNDIHRPLEREYITILDLLDEMRYLGRRKRLHDFLEGLGYICPPPEGDEYELPEVLEVEQEIGDFLRRNQIVHNSALPLEEYI